MGALAWGSAGRSMLPMHPIRRTTLLAAVAASAATALPAAAHAAVGGTVSIATTNAGTRVAGYGANAAWSVQDPTTKLWSLVISRSGAPAQPAAVPPARHPFDVSVGTNRSGSPFAVYTRCSGEGDGVGDGTGCDIYRLSLAPGATEVELTSLSSPSADEQSPAIFAGRIAYVRNEEVHGRVGQTLRLGTTTSGAGDGRVLASTTDRQGSIGAVAISGRRIAYTVTTTGRYGFGAESLHVRGLGRTAKARTAYTATSGGANMAGLTTIGLWTGAPDTFLVARTNQGSGSGNRLLRYDAIRGRFSAATGNANFSSVASTDAGVLATEDHVDDHDGLSAVESLGQPAFHAGSK